LSCMRYAASSTPSTTAAPSFTSVRGLQSIDSA
jgi:hypothetical protein